MEYNPSQTAAYLAGKIDEYVKQSARDTILANVKNDKFARYARIPDGKACDFCKMLGSRGFVYHSEQRAGGDGNDFHPFCNCQIAVSFDPYLEAYKRNGVTVTRGYASDASVVRPGRDGSMMLREVDIDELYDEYLEAGKSYSSGSRYKDYEKKSKLTQRQLAEYADELRNAKTLDELYAVGQRIVDEWQPGAGGRDQHQWGFLSSLAKHREKELKAVIADAPIPIRRAESPWVMDRSAEAYTAMTEEVKNGISECLFNNAGTDEAELYLKHERRLILVDTHHVSSPSFFSEEDGGIYIDLGADVQGSRRRKPFSIWFHENAHHIDYIEAPPNERLLSTSHGNKLGKAVRQDIEDRIELKRRAIQHEWDEAILRKDREWMLRAINEGPFNETTKRSYSNWVNLILQSNVPIEQVHRSAAYTRVVSREVAMGQLAPEILSIPAIESEAISDLFDAVTNKRISGFFRHVDCQDGTTYWEAQDLRLGVVDGGIAMEAFAEFYSDSLTNPAALDRIKEYFPKSYRAFCELVQEVI